MGVGHKAVRKRAVGTRERIMAYLAESGELYDANGMASTQLAAAVGDSKIETLGECSC